MTFQPGVAANPNGRPKGSRNRRTQEILDLIQGRGDKDPLDALSEIITTNQDPNIVATAANILAPYVHSKRGSLPAPRFIPEQIEIQNFQTIQQAEDYLASIPGLLGRGEFDSQTALELSTLTKNWLDAIYARQDYDLKLQAQGGGEPQTIRIEGGMPPLPGTNIIGLGGEEQTPQMNGHSNGHVIDHVEPPALNEYSVRGQRPISPLVSS
jgi:hypothetical protein